MVFSGYLKASTLPELVQNDIHYLLAIPNLEVRKIFFSTFQQWMRDALPGRHRDVDLLLRSLFTGDVQEIQALLNDFAHAILSFHDPAARHPESIYQGFILGLCAVLESTHRVRSNSESGTGRADVLIVPRKPGKAGVVIELKAARTGRKTVKQALIEGRAQLASRDYASELREAGASPLHAYVMAFSGKAVKVEAVTLNG
jgi:hypothetical protein